MITRIFSFLIIMNCLVYMHSVPATERNSILKKNPFIQPIKYLGTGSQIDPSNDMDSSFGSLILRGTLSSKENSIANINGKMLSIGEKINGYEIKKIDVGSAVLIKDGAPKLLVVNEKYQKLR